jgi:hypothetical protein
MCVIAWKMLEPLESCVKSLEDNSNCGSDPFRDQIPSRENLSSRATLNIICSVMWYLCHYGHFLDDISYEKLNKYCHG